VLPGDAMVKDYYKQKGWDENGVPPKTTVPPKTIVTPKP